MKKHLKRFFSLDRHKNSGFTLVELIVVIAILAILAGIAVPVYSGYVNKANQAADEALLYEINQAFRAACIENLCDVFDVEDAKAEISGGTVVVSDVKVNNAIHTKIAEDFVTYFNVANPVFKFHTDGLTFNSVTHQFEFIASTFADSQVMQKIWDVFDNISEMLAPFVGVDPDTIKEELMFSLSPELAQALGMEGMVDGYLAATELEGDELKAALEKYCPEYRALPDDQKDAWIENNPDRIKQLKANLGVMHFANSAADPEATLDKVMTSVDAIISAVDSARAGNVTITTEEVRAYYDSTPRGIKAAAAGNADHDFGQFVQQNDGKLGLNGAALAALDKVLEDVATSSDINTLGAMYALAAGYFNNPTYYQGKQEDIPALQHFSSVTAAMMQDNFMSYYRNQGRADVRVYLEKMGQLSAKQETMDLTQPGIFGGQN